MKKNSFFILILLFSFIIDVNLKQNFLNKLAESELEEEEPILKTNISTLRSEASKITKKLFGFSYSFSAVLFNQEVTIYAGNPKITAKLTSSCSVTYSGKNSGIIQIKGGTVISESGVKTKFTNPVVNAVLKLIGFDVNKIAVSLTSKFKTATTDGTVTFNIGLTKIEISVTVKKSGNAGCDGTVTFTISPNGANPVKQEAIENALVKVTECGALAIACIVLFKLAKGVAFGAVGGPVGFALGVAT